MGSPALGSMGNSAIVAEAEPQKCKDSEYSQIDHLIDLFKNDDFTELFYLYNQTKNYFYAPLTYRLDSTYQENHYCLDPVFLFTYQLLKHYNKNLKSSIHYILSV